MQFVNLLIYIKLTFWLGNFLVKLGKKVEICHWDRGLITAPEIPKKKKSLHSQFLALHFGENIMKIQTKILKLQMFDILHKNSQKM